MNELYLKIFGQVQDVGFRYHVLQQAKRLGLRGIVRNLSDGSVEIVAQGGKPALEKFLSWTRLGPTNAVVDRVEETWRQPTTPYPDFTIE